MSDKRRPQMTDPFLASPFTDYRLPSTTPSPRQRWDERYASLAPQERWEPTPFVTACLPQLPRQGSALDIAAGAGRHSLALAQHGLHVDAVDISGQGLHLAQQRAWEAGLTPGAICFILADLERPWLPQRCYDVILVSFFLYRPLFSLIKERLRPGGWLVYETLTTTQTFGPGHQLTRREFLLEPQELKQAFAEFEILFYAEVNQGQRATAQLLARKVPSRR
ncbi:MAG: methyltransferase domain-containing protein [Chloroflexi bacterium]|nr:methyltransferase domain-containing protein [Chloroflexota bacterium]